MCPMREGRDLTVTTCLLPTCSSPVLVLVLLVSNRNVTNQNLEAESRADSKGRKVLKLREKRKVPQRMEEALFQVT